MAVVNSKDYLKNVNEDVVKNCFGECVSGDVVCVTEFESDEVGKFFKVEYTSIDDSDYEQYNPNRRNLNAVSYVGAYGLLLGLGVEDLSYHSMVTPFDKFWAQTVAGTLTEEEKKAYFTDYAFSKTQMVYEYYSNTIKELNASVEKSMENIEFFKDELISSVDEAER